MPEQHNFAMYTIDSRCDNVLQATCDICNKCKLCLYDNSRKFNALCNL